MWLLHLLPDSFILFIVYLVMTAGGVLTALSYLIKWIPGISTYKLPMRIGGILLLISGVYFYGGYSTEMIWRERVAEMEAKVAEAEQKSAKVNTVVEEKIVYKTKVIKQQETVYRDRIKEVAVQIDAKCDVDPTAIDILNKAATDPAKGAK